MEEVVGVDRIMRQAARRSSKVGKHAFDIAMQYGLSGIDSFIKADRAAKLTELPAADLGIISQLAIV